MESVQVAGIDGVITIQQESATSPDYTYFFTRNQDGESTDVEKGTEIITYASAHYLDYLLVIFIGQNGGYDDTEELISQQRAIINHQLKNAGRFVIIGLHTGTAEERAILEAAMEAEYGDKYINLREYMSTCGIEDANTLLQAGIQVTDEDKEMMEQGMTPASLLSDKVHFTAVGYELIGHLLYDRMDQLGYFSEVKAAIKAAKE